MTVLISKEKFIELKRVFDKINDIGVTIAPFTRDYVIDDRNKFHDFCNCFLNDFNMFLSELERETKRCFNSEKYYFGYKNLIYYYSLVKRCCDINETLSNGRLDIFNKYQENF